MSYTVSPEINFDQFKPDELIEISYVSQATQDMGILSLMNLLEDAIYVNKSKEVTGILLYDFGVFGQILEGDRKNLEYIWPKICIDIRHKNIQVLEVNPLKNRNFSQWAMNFYGDDQINKVIPQAGERLSKAMNGMPQEILRLMRSVASDQNNSQFKQSESKPFSA
jgi:hypothetical protein